MKRTYWDNLTPRGETLDQIIYNIRKDDTGKGLLLDAVQVADIYGDFDGLAPVFDALAVQESKLDRVADWMKSKMDAAGLTITTKDGQLLSVLSVERLPTLTKGGFANIPIHYKLSDGQTVTIYFHNPDATPKAFKPTDEMIAWKWLLNKKDVTIAVASDDSSKDLDVKVVAMRIIKLAAKNSAAFQRANAKVAERAAQIEGLKTEVSQLENTLTDKQNELEALKAELLSKQAAPQPTPEPEPEPTPEPETVQPAGQIDPATLANLNASSLSAAIKKKAIAFFEKNPIAKSFEGSRLGKPSQKSIMESIKTALFAEIKALSPLFEVDKNVASITIDGNLSNSLYIQIDEDNKSPTGMKMSFSIPSEDGYKNLFDSTTTLEDLRAWDFALPFDLDVKAFVANVIKPVVDEFLSKQQATTEPEPEPKSFTEMDGVKVDNYYRHRIYDKVLVTNIVENLDDKKDRIPYVVEFVDSKGVSQGQGLQSFKEDVADSLKMSENSQKAADLYGQWSSRYYSQTGELPSDALAKQMHDKFTNQVNNPQPQPPAQPENNVTDSFDAEIESLRGLIGTKEFDTRIDSLIEDIDSKGLMAQYEPKLLELDRDHANAKAAKARG